MNFFEKLELFADRNYVIFTILSLFIAIIFYCLSSVLFNQYSILVYGILVGIQLFLFFKTWLKYEQAMPLELIIPLILCILCFALMMFDEVHLKNDWYFLPWGAIIGGIISVVNIKLIVTQKNYMLKSTYKFHYLSILFVLSTIYFNGLLSLGNIFNAKQFVKWEKAKVTVPFLLMTPGGSFNDAEFENEEWGSRFMNLFFMEWEGNFPGEMTAEVKVFKGNFGKDYMLKTYDQYEKVDARQLY